MAGHHLGAVVGREDDDRVVGHPRVLQLVEDPADIGVGLYQDVRPGPVSGHPLELCAGLHRSVGLGIGNEGEERLLVGRLAPDEVDDPFGDLSIHLQSGCGVVDLDLVGHRALSPVVYVLVDGRRVGAFLEVDAVRPERLVAGVGDPVPLVEALIGREPPLGLTEMPLARTSPWRSPHRRTSRPWCTPTGSGRRGAC